MSLLQNKFIIALSSEIQSWITEQALKILINSYLKRGISLCVLSSNKNQLICSNYYNNSHKKEPSINLYNKQDGKQLCIIIRQLTGQTELLINGPNVISTIKLIVLPSALKFLGIIDIYRFIHNWKGSSIVNDAERIFYI